MGKPDCGIHLWPCLKYMFMGGGDSGHTQNKYYFNMVGFQDIYI